MTFFNINEILMSEDGNSTIDKTITTEVAAAALGIFFKIY